MNEEVKKDWLEAMRSGEYEQGTCSLRTGDKFCCLGVLTDLAVKKGLGEWEDDVYYSKVGYGKASVTLPPDVIKWSGLTDDNPYVQHEDVTFKKTLAGLNDEGLSFKEIADIIEEQL